MNAAIKSVRNTVSYIKDNKKKFFLALDWLSNHQGDHDIDLDLDTLMARMARD